MALSITGKAMGSTSLDLKAGTITKTIPVSVRSTNLLAYGPASGNNLNVTVAKDGSLDLASTEAIEIGKGVQWPALDLSEYVGRTLCLGFDGDLAPQALVIVLRDANEQNGVVVYTGNNNQTFTVTEANKNTLMLKFVRGGVDAGIMTGNIKIRLTIGDTPQTWMRPDVTNLSGGA
ncbi:hypothetical protein BLI708_00440 [Bifidobacterium imperatoris]|uniref:Uncharacterized protein n=1 Tax=Bifidobacterium imperatoris TaxID=2020965 RepID=A0A2N5IP61_9BIFI|nr:hypothetical protein [Bifidobacterium imperatoris]PLS23759.1 hypothetical protein Tam1G_2190 [Bifidobacterium imperatoris]QSY57796.1 hypothetical protein BLI708_00145 [Bifidobacterium imperatoris]QSY57845.1 hypothetical protein BLI708_00440 [Bifidobacterium imperatoris]